MAEQKTVRKETQLKETTKQVFVSNDKVGFSKVHTVLEKLESQTGYRCRLAALWEVGQLYEFSSKFSDYEFRDGLDNKEIAWVTWKASYTAHKEENMDQFTITARGGSHWVNTGDPSSKIAYVTYVIDDPKTDVVRLMPECEINVTSIRSISNLRIARLLGYNETYGNQALAFARKMGEEAISADINKLNREGKNALIDILYDNGNGSPYNLAFLGDKCVSTTGEPYFCIVFTTFFHVKRSLACVNGPDLQARWVIWKDHGKYVARQGKSAIPVQLRK